MGTWLRGEQATAFQVFDVSDMIEWEVKEVEVPLLIRANITVALREDTLVGLYTEAIYGT